MSEDRESESKCIPSRERLWTERDVDQKLEALRQQIVQLTHLTYSMSDESAGMNRHEHGVDGRILVPLVDNNIRPYRRDRVPTALRDKE